MGSSPNGRVRCNLDSGRYIYMCIYMRMRNEK